MKWLNRKTTSLDSCIEDSKTIYSLKPTTYMWQGLIAVDAILRSRFNARNGKRPGPDFTVE